MTEGVLALEPTRGADAKEGGALRMLAQHDVHPWSARYACGRQVDEMDEPFEAHGAQPVARPFHALSLQQDGHHAPRMAGTGASNRRE